jgi:hypothetical protein
MPVFITTCHACIFHDVSMDNSLKIVLEHGGDANLQKGHGRTPLFAAVTASEDSESPIRLLLVAGADIDHQDLYGDTPAMFAERHRRYDSLLVLLEANANLRLVNKSGIDVVFMVGRRFNWSKARAENDTLVVNWLRQRGYNLEAARQACESDLPLRGVPIDQRPWLCRKPDAPKGEPGERSYAEVWGRTGTLFLRVRDLTRKPRCPGRWYPSLLTGAPQEDGGIATERKGGCLTAFLVMVLMASL